jgi:hypothetical protein
MVWQGPRERAFSFPVTDPKGFRALLSFREWAGRPATNLSLPRGHAANGGVANV